MALEAASAACNDWCDVLVRAKHCQGSERDSSPFGDVGKVPTVLAVASLAGKIGKFPKHVLGPRRLCTYFV